MKYTVLLALPVLAAASEDCDFLDRLGDGSFADGDLAFSVYFEQNNQLHLTCYALGVEQNGSQTYLKQKTTSEFQRAQVGVASKKLSEDAEYPCESQDSFGQLNLEVMELNGQSPYEEGADSISVVTEPTCNKDEEHAFYGGSGVQVSQVVSEHLTINAYVFRNAAAQEAAKLQHTMSIGQMDMCKMELIYAFKPKSGGGLDARIQVRQHAFFGEETVNQAMVASRNEADNTFSVYLPKNRMLEGNGLGPEGCGSTFETVSDEEMVHLVDVSLSFICGATEQVIDGGDFSFEGNSLSLSLSAEQAPESCGVLYWDPLITPFLAESKGVLLGELAESGAAVHWLAAVAIFAGFS
jgi:hypothetical protein